MPRRRYRRSSNRTPRRRTAWTGFSQDPVVLGPGGQGVSNLLGHLPDATVNPLYRQGLTLLRIVGSLRLNSTDATLSAEGHFGFIMSDGDAFASLTLPDPAVDHEAPWMHWDRRVFLPPSDSQQHLALDIRVKRKMKGNDDTCLLIVDNDDAAQSIEYAFGFRLLLQLP